MNAYDFLPDEDRYPDWDFWLKLVCWIITVLFVIQQYYNNGI